MKDMVSQSAFFDIMVRRIGSTVDVPIRDLTQNAKATIIVNVASV